MPSLPVEAFQNQFFLIPLTIWSIAWKGLALWRASKNDQKYWFIALLIINTIGLLEIIFLVWFAKKDRFWDKIAQGQAWGKSKSSSTKRT